jgi:hypothetical protein
MAAMPKKVRSFIVSTRFNPPPPCESSLPSAIMLSIFLVLNKDFDIRKLDFKKGN